MLVNITLHLNKLQQKTIKQPPENSDFGFKVVVCSWGAHYTHVNIFLQTNLPNALPLCKQFRL